MERWVDLIRNCSAFEQLQQELFTGEGSNIIDEFEGGYNDGLLYVSFAFVFCICLFVIYAFVRSARFRHRVRAILRSQRLRTLFMVFFFSLK